MEFMIESREREFGYFVTRLFFFFFFVRKIFEESFFWIFVLRRKYRGIFYI